MAATASFPQPLSTGLFCAPRNAEVVRDDLEKSAATLVSGCLRPWKTDPISGIPTDPPVPLLSALGRCALLTAELVSLGWLRPLADALDHIIRAYRTQPKDVQDQYLRDAKRSTLRFSRGSLAPQ